MQNKSTDYLLSRLEDAKRGYSNYGGKIDVSKEDEYVLALIKECDSALTYKVENYSKKKEALNIILNAHIRMGFYSDFRESFDYVSEFIPFEKNIVKTIEELALKLETPTMIRVKKLQEEKKVLEEAQDILSK